MGGLHLNKKNTVFILLFFIITFPIKNNNNVEQSKNNLPPKPQIINNIETSQINNLGIHLIADFWNCKVPQNITELEKLLKDAAIEANSTPLELSVHKFEPEGITGIIILAESHISIHYWPEKKYAAVDIFTCGTKSKPYEALKYLKKKLKTKKAEVFEIKRGKIKSN
ncbi:adenosylmethionine decarboxylase [Candidatus Dependentiae bacterium]|nr:adenosylmethionine decarboxylase [Candidatus Dependentiae bacterium]